VTEPDPDRGDVHGALIDPGSFVVPGGDGPSGEGSVADNDNGGRETYRASKSALNQLMRSFAARHAGDPHTLLLMAPGWVQTDLGGPGAPLTIGQSIPGVAGTIEAQAGKGVFRTPRRGSSRSSANTFVTPR
jgi:NAD(P)-dependent dehydrogenase (short-subunit alcohol dehydrogenase family)